jgi:two-component system cell cycle sensor histidine kinase/response regulator CckA
MDFWMAGCAVSIAANAFLLRQWLRRSAEAARLTGEADVAALEIRMLSEALAASQSDLRAVAASPLIGLFSWKHTDPLDANANAGRDDAGTAGLAGTANAAFLRMMGFSAPDIGAGAEERGLGIPCALGISLFGESEMRGLGEKGRCGPVEAEILRADGSKVRLIVAAELRPGYHDRAICVAVDISGYHEAKRQLRRTEDRYRALAESSPVGIWNIRPDGTTIYLNPAMSATLELESPGELMISDTSYLEFFTPDSVEIIGKENGKRSRGLGSSYEVEVVGRWGKRTRMVLYGAPVLAPDGAYESLMGTFLDITDRKREEEALRQSEERLRVAAECGNDLIYEWSLASGKLEWFGPVEQRLGYTQAEVPRTRDAWERLVHPEDRARVVGAMERHSRAREPLVQEYRIRCKDGSYRLWTDRGTAIWDPAGIPEKWIGSASDVTEARRAEEALRVREDQLRQSQKLEAVGRLAGGIAHDFNNLLAAIMGYCELMLLRLEPEHICRKEVGEILKGSDRAAGLIRQLLAFSRQEIPQPKVIEPSFVIRSMERMLNHLLEENIRLSLHMDEDSGRVRMDPVQMEQVIMNLILNARDAMPEGGSLAISARNVDLHGEVPGAYGRVHAGPHVRISVADSGLGIDAEHLPHIFDPFYTTKDRGKGNGLGLSTVYGIITQNQGCVLVETEVSKGSVFSFFLPSTQEEPELEAEVQKALRSSSIVPKTVLLVEDDNEVRGIVRELLGQQGFLVLEASQGREALALAEKYSQPVHLLLTDVVMPEMGGKDLADALRRIMPGLRVLFMSGYTQDAAFREEVAGGDRNFIQKPFSMGSLLNKIREALV